jgi:hypothetical protein
VHALSISALKLNRVNQLKPISQSRSRNRAACRPSPPPRQSSAPLLSSAARLTDFTSHMHMITTRTRAYPATPTSPSRRRVSTRCCPTSSCTPRSILVREVWEPMSYYAQYARGDSVRSPDQATQTNHVGMERRPSRQFLERRLRGSDSLPLPLTVGSRPGASKSGSLGFAKDQFHSLSGRYQLFDLSPLFSTIPRRYADL